MKININEIRRAGKDSENFLFKYQPQEDVITLPNVVFNEDVDVDVVVTITGDELFVDCKVTFQLKGDCTRCLKETIQQFSFDIYERVTKFKSESEYVYCKDVLDLSKMVDDNLILNMPHKILCDENCQGISYKCD